MTTYRLVFPGAGSFVRVMADTDEATREIAHCQGSVIGGIPTFRQATEDARLLVAALNAYQEQP